MAQIPDIDVTTISVGGSAYTVPFAYQNRAEVFVEVDGVSTPFTWINDGNISITPAPAAGAVVRRYRSTSALEIRHDYRNGVPFTPKNIAENNDQLLFVVQESVNDTAATAALALDTAELALDTAQSALDLVGERTQYMVLGPYGPGLYFQTHSQVFSYMGEFYAPGPAITLPYTTTGVGAAEIANFRSVGDAVLRQDLADDTDPDKGAGQVGFDPALLYVAGTVGAELVNLQTIPANEVILVPSQFATIQAACAEVIKRRYDLNVTVEIRLEAGYQIPTGVDIRNSDLRNVRLTSVDATVSLAPGFVGVSLPFDTFGTGAIFYGENSQMFRLSCLVDAADVGGPGYYLNLNSVGYVAGGCGVINAGKFGLYIVTGSEAIATNANFSGANWGNRVTVGSRLVAPLINCSGAKRQNYEGSNVVAAMDVSRGSIVYITGVSGNKTNLTNSAGRGLAVRRSFVSATHVDVSGAALDGIRATTGAWIAANGASANNCLVDNVSCYASWIDGSDSLVATGAGRYGLLVQDGGKANCRGANFSGAIGGRGVSVVTGGSATITGANCRVNGVSDQVTDIYVSDGSIIHAVGALGGTNVTPLTLTVHGLIFK